MDRTYVVINGIMVKQFQKWFWILYPIINSILGTFELWRSNQKNECSLDVGVLVTRIFRTNFSERPRSKIINKYVSCILHTIIVSQEWRNIGGNTNKMVQFRRSEPEYQSFSLLYLSHYVCRLFRSVERSVRNHITYFRHRCKWHRVCPLFNVNQSS